MGNPWLKNVNGYWVCSTSFAVWFLFIHSPPLLRSRNLSRQPLFVIHLAGSYVVYLACIFNSINTGTGGSNIKYHRLCGRVGLVAGTLAFIGGILLVVFNSDTLDVGFSIGITVGGFMQMRVQHAGYKAIREYQSIKRDIAALQWKKSGKTVVGAVAKPYREDQHEEDRKDAETKLLGLKADRDRALREHVAAMIRLFVMACGMPGTIRLLDALGLESVWWNLVVLIPMNLFAGAYVKLMVSSHSSLSPPATPTKIKVT